MRGLSKATSSASRWQEARPTATTQSGTRARRRTASRHGGHVLDDEIAEFRTAHLLGALHQALEIVGDGLASDGLRDGLEDHVAGLAPAHVTEHLDTGKNDRARIDHVLVGVLGRATVRGLEKSVKVPDVPAGRNAQTPYLRRHRIGDKIPVEVGGGDHLVLVRTRDDLLEHGIRDPVLHDDLVSRSRRRDVLFAHRDGTELLARQLVAPVAERAFRILHDVALVHEGDALAALGDGVPDGLTDEPLGVKDADGLYADAGVLPYGVLEIHAGVEEVDQPFRLRGPLLPLDPRVDVLRGLAVDDHVDQFGALHRARQARDVPARPDAGVKVEDLAQSDVDRAETAADRGREGSLEADNEVAQRLDRIPRKKLVVLLDRILTRLDIEPDDLALAS